MDTFTYEMSTYMLRVGVGGREKQGLGNTIHVLISELTPPYFYLPTDLNLQVGMKVSSS